jgi:hypothetical protein
MNTRPQKNTILSFDRLADLILGQNWKEGKDAKEQERAILSMERDLANKLGISWSAVIYWRNVDRVPLEKALDIQRLFKINLSDLFPDAWTDEEE